MNSKPINLEYEEIDILKYVVRHIDILDKGFVELVDCMPRMVPKGRHTDFRIVEAARQSTGNGLKSLKEDIGLLNYLFRNGHLSPIEFVRFTFKLKIPIFVARQLVRHRMMSMSEQSARYTEILDEWYEPTVFRLADAKNRQGSTSSLNDDDTLQARFIYNTTTHAAYKAYQDLLKLGVAKEQARCLLPVAMYSQMYITIDLRNLFNFLKLRMDAHAQYEMRMLANAIYELIKPVVPNALNAFDNYINESISLTKQEVQSIHECKTEIEGVSKNENSEYHDKLNRLFDNGINSFYFSSLFGNDELIEASPIS